MTPDPATIEAVARAIVKDALGVMAKAGLILAAVSIAVAAVCNWFEIGWEDTADRLHHHHSDLVPMTDYATGCQYLRYQNSSPTPRMGSDGRQICNYRISPTGA